MGVTHKIFSYIVFQQYKTRIWYISDITLPELWILLMCSHLISSCYIAFDIKDMIKNDWTI